MSAALQLYGGALEQRDARLPLLVRDADGAAAPVGVGRWLAPADGADLRLLARAVGPVFDVGCGPGRLLRALAARDIAAEGIDVSPVAVALARRGGHAVHEGNVLGALPWEPASFATALLLDGNLGIGGDPAALLRRVASLLAPGGRVLCELDAPGTGIHRRAVRLERGHEVSEWFAWAGVGCEALDAVAARTGLVPRARWRDGRRWFAELQLSAEEADTCAA